MFKWDTVEQQIFATQKSHIFEGEAVLQHENFAVSPYNIRVQEIFENRPKFVKFAQISCFTV